MLYSLNLPSYSHVLQGASGTAMAVSEPLGGGLFVTNIVFGLVVLIASRGRTVSTDTHLANYACQQS